MKPTIQIRFTFDGVECQKIVSGRDAWALSELMKAGPKGCTPIDTPGPRWSAYVFNLRGAGLAISTLHEPHSGQFSGTHARYVLNTNITIVPMLTRPEAA